MVIKKIETIWALYEYSVTQCFTLTLHFEENEKFAFFMMKSITFGWYEHTANKKSFKSNQLGVENPCCLSQCNLTVLDTWTASDYWQFVKNNLLFLKDVCGDRQCNIQNDFVQPPGKILTLSPGGFGHRKPVHANDLPLQRMECNLTRTKR